MTQETISTVMGNGSVEPTCARRAWSKNRVKPSQASQRVLIMPGTGYNCDRPLLYYAAMALIEDGWYVDRLDVNADLSKTPAPKIFAMLSHAVDEWLADVRRDAVDVAHTGDASVVESMRESVLANDSTTNDSTTNDSVTNNSATNDSTMNSFKVSCTSTQAECAGKNMPRTLVVGKSLSTFIYPHVDSLGVPMALLTPVFSPAPFDPAQSVIPVPGDADYIVGSASQPLICAGTADPLFDDARAHRLSDLIHEYPDANHSIEVPGDWGRSMDYLRDVTQQVVAYARKV